MKPIPLNTSQAPPISVPLRYFAAAPLFLLLASLMLATGTGHPLADIHSPVLLAATHCITLGFMATIMAGAMHQIMPVVIGSPMPASRLTASLIFAPLMSGALLLPAGFILGKPVLLNLAWPLLGFALITFIGASLIGLMRAPAHNATRTAILLSILTLGGSVALGMLLAHGYASGSSLPYAKLAAAHISLSLGGWVTLLIVGVSYQVVPMFQLTPAYPQWLAKGLSPAIFAVLLLGLLPLPFVSRSHWIVIAAQCMFWMFAGCFAVVTLGLQHKRRRRVADATLSFFRLGMLALLGAALFALASLFLPAADRLNILSAMLFLLGFAMSLIHGMLYKIIPFLVWFHLFRGGIKRGIPNMKEVIPETWMWRHLWLHLGTLIAALLASRWDVAIWLAALGLFLQGLLLAYAHFIAISVYRRTLVHIDRDPP